jgi:ribonuclease BN (tRNA processing enzyme)
MEITILGSGTCVPSLERSAACIKIVSGTATIVLDSGPGSLQRLTASGTTINDIDLLCYTHLHIDHTADFVPLLFASKYAPLARRHDLAIMAAPGFRDFYTRLTHAYGDWIVPEAFALNWLDCARPVPMGDSTITSAPVQHTPHSIAFRVEDSTGKSMVYSGDTGYCSDIIELARECDVLVLECSFPDDMRCEEHLSPEPAGRIAAEAGCGRLVLTHMYPVCNPKQACEQASQYFSGDVIAAHDMMKIIT